MRNMWIMSKWLICETLQLFALMLGIFGKILCFE